MKRNLLCRQKETRKGCKPQRPLSFLALLALLSLVPLGSRAAGQEMITLEMKHATILQVLTNISTSTGYDFVYRTADLPSTPVRDFDFRDATIDHVMDRLLSGTALRWSREEGIIRISRRDSAAGELQQPAMKSLSGRVVDADTKKPIQGATVAVPGSQYGAVTDADGNFVLRLPEGTPSIDVRFMGYKNRSVPVGGQSRVEVSLEVDNMEIDAVVVDGATQRRAESYTGSATTIRGDELRRVGNMNIFNSLKNIDPSIYIRDNFTMGSDPNTLPTMDIRGVTSFNEGSGIPNLKSNYQNVPNMPLFILDGFETTAEKIFDLDMNRVESLTILKDAAAKALYGSKAANGVVVIETLRLTASEPVVTYVGSLDLQMPDLSSYNLCNAMEKLDIERSELYYRDSDRDLMVDLLDEYYKKRLMVLQGLDVDWMAKPVRFGYGQKHSVTAEVGKDELRAMIGINYNGVKGVMKGSDRSTTSANVKVTYSYKGFKIQNDMGYTYNTSHDSPFGDYGQFAKLNPYESPYDEFGQVRPFINNRSNPYYDGLINTKYTNGYKQFTNTTLMEANILPGLLVRGRLQIDSHTMEGSDYLPSNHSTQSDPPNVAEDKRRPADERGLYRVNNGERLTIAGDLTINYSQVFADKHMVFANFIMDLSEEKKKEVIHTAQGLPSDNMDDILYALQYQEDSRPTGFSTHQRSIGFKGVFSYSYDDRFISDFTVRAEATSIFGVKNRWAPFWSVGLGWNIHNEAFVTNPAIKQLKLRATIGTSGNQNLAGGSSKSLAVYEYIFGDRYDGQVGSWLQNMENPLLKWERSRDLNIGLDASIWGFNLTVDAYRIVSENMVKNIDIAPSTGFSTVSENIGKVLNKGIEVKASYTLLNRGGNYLTVQASAVANRNKMLKISDAMKSFNDRIISQYTEHTDYLNINNPATLPAVMYYDGVDMEAIWAVRSAGIDPATGNEVLIGRDGQLTYIYKGTDLQVVGSTAPKVRGNFGIQGEFKGIGFSVTCTYQIGAHYMNSTLMNKIENISILDNFDRRALTERWSRPDQMAYFKKLYERGDPSSPLGEASQAYDMRNGIYWYGGDTWYQEISRATSRFVQKRNDLQISQISVYYDLKREWIRKIGLSRLKISAYMNDVATFSTIGIERGTSYPFARTVSFSLTGTF